MRHPPKGWDAALQPFCVSDPIIRWRVKITRPCGLDVPSLDVESPRASVVGSGRCFNYHHSGVQSLEPSFNLIQEDGSASGPLHGWIDSNPIQIVRTIRARRWSVAGKAGQLLFRGEGAEEEIVGGGWSSHYFLLRCSICATGRSEHGIKELDSNIDLLAPKNTSGFENLRDSRTVLRRHVADEDSHQLVPDKRSARCQSSGDVSIRCLNAASHTRRISAV